MTNTFQPTKYNLTAIIIICKRIDKIKIYKIARLENNACFFLHFVYNASLLNTLKDDYKNYLVERVFS